MCSSDAFFVIVLPGKELVHLLHVGGGPHHVLGSHGLLLVLKHLQGDPAPWVYIVRSGISAPEVIFEEL